MTDAALALDYGSSPADVAPAPAAKPRPATSVTRQRRKGRVGLRQVLTVGALIGVACWGAWVTKSIVSPAKPEGQLVKLQLQGMVTEYLQLQARSGNDEQVAAAATTHFMSELDKAVAEVSKSGRVVLVNEAVIGGDIPDITAQVKKAVYAKVTMPRVAPPTPVQQDLQAYMSANGAPGAPAVSTVPGNAGAAGFNPMGGAGGNAQ